MSTSTLTSKGQTTIPRDIREHLELEPGDRIDFLVDEKGRVYLVPAKRPLGSLAGSLRHRAGKEPVTLEEMDRAVAEGASASTGGTVRERTARGPTIYPSSLSGTVTGQGDRAAEGAPAKKGRNR